jgi:branched-chain amino acid transport system permease protein
VPAAGAAAGLVAVVVGSPLLRLKGHYFAVATLGVAEGLREVVINLPDLTGGGGHHHSHLRRRSDPMAGQRRFLPAVPVHRRRLGGRGHGGFPIPRRLRASGYPPGRGRGGGHGINTTRAKIFAFTGSAVLTGVVGAAHAFQLQSIYPGPEFDVDITVMMVVMVVLGGSGTVLGPIIGAVAVAYLSEWLRSNYTNVHTFMLGALIVAAVILLPQGFANYLSEAVRLRRFSLLENVRRYRL